MQTVITGGSASAPVDFAYVQIGGFSFWPFVNSHDHNRKHSIILWAWGQEECLHVTWPANKSALVHYLQWVSGIHPSMKSQASSRSVGAMDLRADLTVSSSGGCVRPYTNLNLSGQVTCTNDGWADLVMAGPQITIKTSATRRGQTLAADTSKAQR